MVASPERMERIVGTPMRRTDAPAKLNGQEHFAGDLAIPGLLHARPVLSAYAHARLTGVDATAASKFPRVVAVLTAGE